MILPANSDRPILSHRTQAIHVFFAERIPPPPEKFLNELPVGRLVRWAVATVEVHPIDLSRVVVRQARTDHVPVRDLSLQGTVRLLLSFKPPRAVLWTTLTQKEVMRTFIVMGATPVVIDEFLTEYMRTNSGRGAT